MAKNSLTDLLAQKAALDKKIADMQRAHRSDAINKVKAMMAEFGLTVEDIAGAPAGPTASARPAGAVPPAGRASAATAASPADVAKRRKLSANAGKKVAPKYRNPATGDTWTGRGLKPKWLVAALGAGRSLSEFAL